MLDARLARDQVLRDDVACEGVGLHLGRQVRVRVRARSLLRGPALGAHDRVALGKVVLVGLRREAADELGLQVESVRVGQPNLRRANVSVVDQDVRQRARHRPVQHRRPRDAVGGRDKLVDLDVLLDQVAVLGKVDAVPQDLGVVVVEDRHALVLLAHRVLLPVVGGRVLRSPLFLRRAAARVLSLLLRFPGLRGHAERLLAEALQALLLALVGVVAARRHATEIALQRVRHAFRIVEEALPLLEAALRRDLVHVADVLVHGWSGGAAAARFSIETAPLRGDAARHAVVDRVDGPREDAQRDDLGDQVPRRDLAQAPRHEPQREEVADRVGRKGHVVAVHKRAKLIGGRHAPDLHVDAARQARRLDDLEARQHRGLLAAQLQQQRVRLVPREPVPDVAHVPHRAGRAGLLQVRRIVVVGQPKPLVLAVALLHRFAARQGHTRTENICSSTCFFILFRTNKVRRGPQHSTDPSTPCPSSRPTA